MENFNLIIRKNRLLVWSALPYNYKVYWRDFRERNTSSFCCRNCECRQQSRGKWG